MCSANRYFFTFTFMIVTSVGLTGTNTTNGLKKVQHFLPREMDTEWSSPAKPNYVSVCHQCALYMY